MNMKAKWRTISIQQKNIRAVVHDEASRRDALKRKAQKKAKESAISSGFIARGENTTT